MIKASQIIFFTISLIHLAAQFRFEILQDLTKPLIIPALAWYVFSKYTFGSIEKKLLIAALIFAFGGDTLLMFVRSNSNFFLLGLASFLVMQILYIILFQGITFKGLLQKWSYVLVLAGLSAVLLSEILPKVGSLQLPVLAYFMAIFTMVLSAICIWQKKGTKASTIFVGAVLFLASDGILAYNKFVASITLSGFLVMSTYIAAQYAIAEGLGNIFGQKNK